MEAIISNLLNRFERGALNRRELIQSLTMLTASSAALDAQTQDTGIKPVKIDHVSIQVSDLPRSLAFYREIFGFTVVSEDKPNEIVRLGSGKSFIVSLHHKNPTGLVDHFAIGVENFNQESVARELKKHGANPENNLDAGFHIKDPAGISVQIVGA